MKALVAQELSGPAGLDYTDVDDVGGDGVVVVDVGAAGVSFPDLLLSARRVPAQARAAVRARHGGRRGGAVGAVRLGIHSRGNGLRR